MPSNDHQHQAAQLHDQAAHAHLVAAAHGDKQDHPTGHEHSRQALEHSQEAHRHSQLVFGHETISELAHQLWRERGCPHGSPDMDWFEAAKRLRAHSATSDSNNKG